MQRLDHEKAYRGADVLERLATTHFVLCGAGALGSHLADHWVRLGAKNCRVIDRDIVEAHNSGTQLYGEHEAGVAKVEALKNRLFRACGTEIDAVRQGLTVRNASKLLRGAGLVVDLFDNSASRQLVQDNCRSLALPCLHVGLNADYAEILWDAHYRVPKDLVADVCAYPLARSLVLLAVAVATETMLAWLATGHSDNWTITLRDFAVRAATVCES